ncbi:MAG TPA: hypothetical protein VG371_11090 [Solirubrobacteraceae bacterium]|jgi:hypothetical protein|nr:hypothetical protein [Solirubrobacteraceae bacterium]
MLALPHRHRRHAVPLIVALAVVCVCGALAVATAAATGRPASVQRTLALTARDPATVHGRGFSARIRVLVTLVAQRTYVRRAQTNNHGAFTVTFPTTVDRCTSWSVTAAQRNAAPVIVHGPKPQCAPASTP